MGVTRGCGGYENVVCNTIQQEFLMPLFSIGLALGKLFTVMLMILKSLAVYIQCFWMDDDSSLFIVE
jgi:hypothetical protein